MSFADTCKLCAAKPTCTPNGSLCSLCIAAELAQLNAAQLRNVVDSSRDMLLSAVEGRS